MTTSTDIAVHDARASIERSRDRRANHSVGRKSKQLKIKHAWQKFMRFFVAAAVIMVAAGVIGAVLNGIGFWGVMIVALAILGAGGVFANWPKLPEATRDTLRQTDLGRLPAQTELFLEAQRPALPAPARTLVDGIGAQLDELSDQLRTLDPQEPAALEVRRLVAEDLPELITGYRRVPLSLRTKEINGRKADDQLIDGLKLIEREIGTMTEQIASGDLDRLATRKRFLELKYDGDAAAD
jgi:hypothetical protein